MSAAELLNQIPSEDAIREELGDTLRRVDALRELLKIARRLPKKDGGDNAKREGRRDG